MSLKMSKVIFWPVFSLALIIVGLKVYLLAVTRRLPWQKAVMDTQLPTVPTYISERGVLIFSKTNGFRHTSIEAGVAAIVKSGKEKGWDVHRTESGAFFNKKLLCKFKVVIFLSTTGDILTNEQQGAFERWVADGGGFVGIHSAADTEYDWFWYDQLLGTHFRDHAILPNGISKAQLFTYDPNHPATKNLPPIWTKEDEWYNYKENVTDKPGFHVLLMLNESSFQSWISTELLPTVRMGINHPISWTQLIGHGRMFYTGIGHTAETFSDKYALPHILAGIEWAGKLAE